MADVRRYNPGQERDPDGKWGDGVPGPSTDFFDMAGFNDVVEVEGTFGDLAMGVDDLGDVRIAFREHGKVRELDVGGEDIAALGDALESLADARDDLPDDAGSHAVYEDEVFGADGAYRAELYGSGVIAVTFGYGEDDPYVLWLDPPDAESDEDDVAGLLGAIDEVLTAAGELRSVEQRKYNPNQKRDPNGEWGDGVPGSSALKDALKLAGRIDLGPDERLLGSARVDGDRGGARMALTERNGRRMLRLGVGGEEYGRRNPEMGTVAWDGNPSAPPLPAAERQRLDAEFDALGDEYDSASPARQDEIEARQEEISARLAVDDMGFNGTAVIDESSWRRLADRIRPALAEAIEQEKAENDAYAEIQDLEIDGNPDPERMARLREIARLDTTDGITFASGIVAGSEWGDVHYSVELNDSSQGVEVLLGVTPKGAPDDWGDDKDWQGQFNVAETRKLLRLLDKLTSTAAPSRSKKGAAVDTRLFQPEDHPRAPAGGDTGGQFAKGGGGQKKTTPKRAPKRRPTSAGDGTLAYDAGSGQGTGYDSAGGDPRVHDLQQALNRLGVKDSAGKALKDDGKLGPKTTSAVKALQQKLGVKADGKVTPELLKQIKSMKSLPTKRSAFMDFCVRSFGFEFETRGQANSDGRTLEGYAAVFNSPTRIAAVGGDFDEVISPGAFTRSIRSRMPVLQFEHGRDPRIGAAPIGAIEDLSEDSTGLHVRARLFDHPDIERVRQGIAARAITGMSFRFQVTDGGDRWERRGTDVDLRTVGDADVHELGPVVFPAYDTTTVSVRSLLAQLGPEEHRTLLQELAYDLRSLEPEHIAGRPSARSSGGGDTDKDDGPAEEHLSIRQRLDHGALRTRGILK